jgi:hypothetical protein
LNVYMLWLRRACRILLRFALGKGCLKVEGRTIH